MKETEKKTEQNSTKTDKTLLGTHAEKVFGEKQQMQWAVKKKLQDTLQNKGLVTLLR